MNLYHQDQIIEYFQLVKHPEGGYFKESYRSPNQTDFTHGKRCYSTAIFYLLTKGDQSCLHKISSDEIWHFYLGDSMSLYQISPEGKLEIIQLGTNILSGEKLQHCVPAGYWFGGHSNGQYSFLGCTVAPGFEFSDFTMGEKKTLLKLFPQHLETIEKLTYLS